MNPSEKFRKLLTDLKQATIQNKLEWSETLTESEFCISFDYAMIRVGRWESVDEDGERSGYTAWLIGPKGRVVEQFHGETAEDAALLSELFDLARRSAMKSDDLLDRVIAEVEGLTVSKRR